MYSKNIFDVAKRAGFWDGEGELDFLPTYAPMRTHSIYSTRRVWRVFDIAAPSLRLPGETDAFANDYPFSVPVDKKLTVEDIMGMNRIWGIPDMTKGMLEVFGTQPALTCTYRWMNMTGIGWFLRAFYLYLRTSYYLAVARKNIVSNLLLWYSSVGTNLAHNACSAFARFWTPTKDRFQIWQEFFLKLLSGQ